MTISDEIRKLLIESYLKGESLKYVSSIFGIQYHRVHAIIEVYIKNKTDLNKKEIKS